MRSPSAASAPSLRRTRDAARRAAVHRCVDVRALDQAPPSTGNRWAQFSDGSTHRIISDLSAFIGSADPGTHRILAAGDLNLIHGATRSQSTVHPVRDRTVT